MKANFIIEIKYKTENPILYVKWHTETVKAIIEATNKIHKKRYVESTRVVSS